MNLRPEQIYSFARQAGFSPDQAVTMTAIALAESGGNPAASNTVGERSIGLWQVNLAAHPRFEGADATDPLTNARMAFEVSGGGADIGRWTVTHADRGAPYLLKREEAEAAAQAAGERASGQWDPPDNYHSPKVSAGPPGGGTPPPLLTGDGASVAGNEGALDRFLDAALSQDGDPYIFGAETNLADVDPDAFDCSELVQWAAARAGLEIQDGSFNQYLQFREQGSELTIDEALKTPGALVFSFSSEPVPGGGRPSQAHVAISLGDGRLIEARGRRYGVVVSDAEGRTFTHAARIPDLGTELTGEVVVGELAFARDSDADGLLDAYEQIIRTDPFAADTDRDGFMDSAEIIEHRTDPLDFAGHPLLTAGGGTGYRPALTTDLRRAPDELDGEPSDPLRPGRLGESTAVPGGDPVPPEPSPGPPVLPDPPEPPPELLPEPGGIVTVEPVQAEEAFIDIDGYGIELVSDLVGEDPPGGAGPELGEDADPGTDGDPSG